MNCSICDQSFEPSESASLPFCSDRCQAIDLGRWLDEKYTLPHLPDPEADEVPDDDGSH